MKRISSAVYDYENLLLVNVGGWVAVLNLVAQFEFEFRHPSKIINDLHKQVEANTLARKKLYEKRKFIILAMFFK
jgi:hypothetical protein